MSSVTLTRAFSVRGNTLLRVSLKEHFEIVRSFVAKKSKGMISWQSTCEQER